ncbi:transferase [Lithospermum erythrorhizon]|uniref:Sulfotransferase n=1 Tax=Lithospermum erythrorhizon TaxID=34254 RepID=A0AAV3QLG7_LITER
MDPSHSNEKNVANLETRNEEHAFQKLQKYQEIIANLPKDESIDSEWNLHLYQGFWYFSTTLENVFYLQENFNADPTDILICSPPKSGTTWLKSLSFAIMTRNRFDESSNPLFKAVSHECIPHLESDFASGSFSRDQELKLLGTHLPLNALPKSVFIENCKIVYICRDPKDLVVSMFHFAKKFPWPIFSFERTVERFCEGRSYYGPYWDHVLEYWKMSQEKPENVMFLKYEDMKENTLFYIKKLAEFLGEPFSQEEEMEGVPEKIMNMCSFENLSNLEVNKTGIHREGSAVEIGNNAFFRKGEVGDWKNHFTQKMKEKIDQTTQDKLHGSGFTF